MAAVMEAKEVFLHAVMAFGGGHVDQVDLSTISPELNAMATTSATAAVS